MSALTALDLRHTEDTASALLESKGLTKTYGDQRALDDVSFDVRRGEMLGLLGPNGSGKTTLLEAIAGLLPVDAGAVLWRGAPLSASDRRDVIFYLPDGLRPWDGQHVIHVLDFFASVYGRRTHALGLVIRSVGLEPVLGKRIAALSKGYGRRLMLALALLAPHPALLVDEPFDGFDLRQTRDVMGLLRGLSAAGQTLVLAIHQLADAERICDRFVLLADGRVRGVGTLDELRAYAGQNMASLEDVFLALT